MTRAALAELPTLFRLEDGRDAYLAPHDLAKLRQGAPRWWTFRRQVTTVELPGNRYAKNALPFDEHNESETDFAELMRECRDFGVNRPSGYADAFHRIYKTPPVRWTFNAMLSARFVGGWQEALTVGLVKRPVRRYDIRSAYLWAGGLGLPDPRSYRLVRRIVRDRAAVYDVEHVPRAGLPYPFSTARHVLATDEEIETYSLDVRRVSMGVTWETLIDPGPMLDAIRQFSFWKAAARSYWGRWAMTSRVECHVGDKSWPLKSISANVVWAALIVARVKLKTWLHARDAVHVFVDSVITPHALPTGPKIGDWKLEQEYPEGVAIRAPGWYGAIGGPFDKTAGVPVSLREIWAERWAAEVAEMRGAS